MAIDIYEMALRFKSEGFATVSRDMDTLDKKGKGIAKAFTALKATLIVGAVGGFIRKIAVESIEAQKQTAQLNAVLKSTGGIAGVTAGEIDEMAGSLQKTTTFSDEAVKSSAALLLSFTNIRGEIFKNTLPAITDMATALGTDLNSATLQVGKALQDPIRGITALRRAGVSFSEAQQAVIKNLVATNRLAEAQGVILKELTVQFGGSAEAARNTLGGALTGLSNAWGDLFEVTQDSSKGIIGAINSITDNLPAVRQKFDSFFEGLKNGFLGLVLGYKRDAADIARVMGFLANLSSKISFGAERAALAQTSAAWKTEAARLDVENRMLGIQLNSKARKGLGDLGRLDPLDGGGKPRKNAPPFGGTGGGGAGSGKAGKGPQIPSFNMPEFQLPGTIFDDVDSGHLDMFGALVPAMEESYENFRKSQKALGERFKTDAEILWESIAESTKAGIANTLGDAIYNGFAAAFNGEGVGGILKAFGKTILAGLGDIMVQQGQALLAYGITMQAAAWGFTNPFTAGPAAIAAGAALIALGSAFGAIAKGGGGRGTAQSGAFRESGRGTEELTRLRFVNRDGTAAGLTPRQAINFTVIGPNDPAAQRAIMKMIENGSRRQG